VTQHHRMPSLCKTLGHEWALTTADNYRRCLRESCRCAERLVNGTWVEVTATTKRRARKASSLSARQSLLPFDEHALLKEGIHPEQQARERRALEQYYQTVGQR
jgi:hypothetical protein